MKKVLIISDSHGAAIRDYIRADYEYKQYLLIKNGIEQDLISCVIDENIEISILLLSKRTAYNCSNHLELITKYYSNHYVIFFMGYNDLAMIDNNNIEKTAYKYIFEASLRFDKSKTIVISPLNNKQLIEKDPIHSQFYEQYVFHIKKSCQEVGIKYLDIHEFIENITDQDYRDEDHLKPDKYLPILEYAINL